MWAPFDLLFIFFFIFWAEVPPLLNGGIFKRLPTMMSITIVWKMPKNGENKLFSIENACISTIIWSKLRTVLNFGLIFIILSKLNGKQLADLKRNTTVIFLCNPGSINRVRKHFVYPRIIYLGQLTLICLFIFWNWRKWWLWQWNFSSFSSTMLTAT